MHVLWPQYFMGEMKILPRVDANAHYDSGYFSCILFQDCAMESLKQYM